MKGTTHHTRARRALAALILSAGLSACAFPAVLTVTVPAVTPSAASPRASAPPVAAGVAAGLPVAAALLCSLMRRKAPRDAVCPVCHARRGTEVGPVGAYRKARRCQNCGFLW